MASVFPLLETIQFDTSTYSLENQARMISSQPSWRDYMTQLKSEPMDTALFDNPSDNIHQLKHKKLKENLWLKKMLEKWDTTYYIIIQLTYYKLSK